MKKQIKTKLMLSATVPCALAWLIFLSATTTMAAKSEEDQQQPEKAGEQVLDLEGEEQSVDSVLKPMAELLGERNWLDKIEEARIKLDQEATERIHAASDGAVQVKREDGRWRIHIDKLKVRRKEKSIRQGFRQLMSEWFPKAASAVAATYGLRVLDADGRALAINDAKPLPDTVVILAHGLDEPGRLWRDVIPVLQGDAHVVCEFRYPNDQAVVDSAMLFAKNMQMLHAAGVRRVAIVAHSMGGLVSREMLTSPALFAGRGGPHKNYPTVERLITVGTPNHGSQLARLRLAVEIRDQVVRHCSGDGMLFGSIFDGTGEAKIDLLPGSEFLTDLNKRPLPGGVQITVIAGRASPMSTEDLEAACAAVRKINEAAAHELGELRTSLGHVVNGVGDGAVTLESTRLAGATDYHVVEGNHVTMLRRMVPGSKRMPTAIPLIKARLKTMVPTDRDHSKQSATNKTDKKG